MTDGITIHLDHKVPGERAVADRDWLNRYDEALADNNKERQANLILELMGGTALITEVETEG